MARIRRLDDRLNAFVTVTEEGAVERARALEGGAGGRPVARPAARHPDRPEGQPRHRRGADDGGERGLRPTASPTRTPRVVTRPRGRGRDRPRQAQHARVRLRRHVGVHPHRPRAQPVGHWPHPRRVVRRLGGGGRGAAVRRRPRHRHGGIGPHPPPRTAASWASSRPTGWRASAASFPLSVSLDHVGPMCRSVADAALMLQPMAGYDPRGIASIEADIPDYAGALRRRTSAMRLGVPRAFYEDVDPQVLAAVERALGVLGGLTAGARDVELPPLPEARTVGVEAYAYHADLLEERRGLYAESTLARIEGGAEMSAADYAEARYQLALVRKAVAAAFDDVDVLGHADAGRASRQHRGGDGVAARGDGDAHFATPRPSTGTASPPSPFRAASAARACPSGCSSAAAPSARSTCSRSRTPTSRRRTGTSGRRRCDGRSRWLPARHRFQPHDPARPAAVLDREVDVAVWSSPDIPHPADAVGQGLRLLDAVRPVDGGTRPFESPEAARPPFRRLTRRGGRG